MSKIMKKLIGGNWKMNGSSENIHKIGVSKVKLSEDVDVFIAVPYIFIKDCIKHFPCDIKVAAQDVSSFENGAYTGEISAQYLQEYHVKYVLIGHSERRTHQKETDILINSKMKLALKHGRRPVLCIGESQQERRTGKYEDFLFKQFSNSIKELEGHSFDVAYEPVWAIGTGEVAKNEEVALKIKEWMANKQITGRLIYGGSVCEKNVLELKKIKSLDGLLIGNSSLGDEFERIIKKYMAFHEI